MRRSLYAICLTLLLAGCRQAAVQPVQGILTEPATAAAAPAAVRAALDGQAVDDRYETLLEDGDLQVWSLLRCSEDVSSEGYGILVRKADHFTAFPDIRHGRMPQAAFDRASGILWIVGGEIEGTGVQVDRLWQLKIGEGGRASIADSIDPFEMQEALCTMLGYRLQGGTLAFYDHETLLASVPCTGEGLDADPVRIGEQLTYLPGDTLKVRFTPGLRAADGGALDYEGMPDLEATVTWTEDGFALSDLQVVE